MPVRSITDGWVLETRHTAYAFGLNRAGLLTHRYWGRKLPYPDDYPPAANPGGFGPFNEPSHLTPEEYPAYVDLKYIEPCLKVTHPDGVRDAELRFESAEIGSDGETLHIHLHDVFYPLRVTLHYRSYVAYDLIERSVTITNEGAQPIRMERAFSAQWHLPIGDDYRLTHLAGRWFDEMHIHRESMPRGVTVLESRRLTSGHNSNPWFAVDRGSAEEEHGEVWFGLLEWSGNWKIAAEVTDFFSTRINIGLNDWDFVWRLRAGEAFTTPSSYAGYTEHGFGAASRLMHDFVRETVLPHPHVINKVYYNSWEVTQFDFTIDLQLSLVDLAASMGCEMFMIDDGWALGRLTQDTGLGDWWPDKTKFPDGLEPLVNKVNAAGMDFGLWFEPENVNPDSILYREHPDWVIHYPTRKRREGRSSLHLNFARQDVQDHVIESVSRALTAYNVRYVNWDMNRCVSEPGWPDAPADVEPQELWVRYVYGLYRVWGELRQRHPDVIFQSCAGGGGRIDLGMLRLTDMIWISDASGAAARLPIQEGYTLMFPAATMQAWVTDQQSEHTLAFKFHSAMCGVLGIGADITKWSAADIEEARQWIALYKEIRHLIQYGDLYRLRPAYPDGFTAVQYMSKNRDEGVLFAFRTYNSKHEPSLTLRLRGLEPNARYTVEGFEGVFSGEAWMQRDLQFGLYGGLYNFQSTVRRIKNITE